MSVNPRDPYMSITELARWLSGFGRNCWHERSRLIRLIGMGFVIGLLLAFGSGEEYTASTKILPYRNGSGGTSGLSSLAGLAGVRLPAGGGEQTITADLYPEVAKSQELRIAIAETPLHFAGLNRRATTIEYFRDLRARPLTELIAAYSLELPTRLLRSLSRSGAVPPNVSAQPDSTSTVVLYDQRYLELVNILQERITVSIDRKTSLITISAKMPDPFAAADLVDVTAKHLMDRIIHYETRKAGEQFRFVNEQFGQAQSRYVRAQRELAVFRDRNRTLMSATAELERDRLQREHDLSYEVYQQFSRELEQSRIKMNQDTPVFAALDRVAVPTRRSAPRRPLIIIASVLIALTVGVSHLGMRQLLAENRHP
jgi:G-rich domain on putative tyrosine kinase